MAWLLMRGILHMGWTHERRWAQRTGSHLRDLDGQRHKTGCHQRGAWTPGPRAAVGPRPERLVLRPWGWPLRPHPLSRGRCGRQGSGGPGLGQEEAGTEDYGPSDVFLEDTVISKASLPPWPFRGGRRWLSVARTASWPRWSRCPVPGQRAWQDGAGSGLGGAAPRPPCRDTDLRLRVTEGKRRRWARDGKGRAARHGPSRARAPPLLVQPPAAFVTRSIFAK